MKMLRKLLKEMMKDVDEPIKEAILTLDGLAKENKKKKNV